ncbi:hypothetical protein M9H77_07272 [Catharanthus roseus]|uniref:Uncharacterized protein n=1 Tax=Catharanthus roseus TaxID=4058 RepID=A0ACC0BUQ5_CATRO|nr:hypothetical protein M9H77_07272 [Catharanthus roseus]
MGPSKINPDWIATKLRRQAFVLPPSVSPIVGNGRNFCLHLFILATKILLTPLPLLRSPSFLVLVRDGRLKKKVVIWGKYLPHPQFQVGLVKYWAKSSRWTASDEDWAAPAVDQPEPIAEDWVAPATSDWATIAAGEEEWAPAEGKDWAAPTGMKIGPQQKVTVRPSSTAQWRHQLDGLAALFEEDDPAAAQPCVAGENAAVFIHPRWRGAEKIATRDASAVPSPSEGSLSSSAAGGFNFCAPVRPPLF